MENVDIWCAKAANLLKSELAKQGVEYKGLQAKLAAIGIEVSYGGLANRINRGAYNMAFFLQCMEALGIKEVRT